MLLLKYRIGSPVIFSSAVMVMSIVTVPFCSGGKTNSLLHPMMVTFASNTPSKLWLKLLEHPLSAMFSSANSAALCEYKIACSYKKTPVVLLLVCAEKDRDIEIMAEITTIKAIAKIIANASFFSIWFFLCIVSNSPKGLFLHTLVSL